MNKEKENINERKGSLISCLNRWVSAAKEWITFCSICAGVALLIFTPFYIKFKVWEVQHPDAPTWSFFLPDGR